MGERRIFQIFRLVFMAVYKLKQVEVQEEKNADARIVTDTCQENTGTPGAACRALLWLWLCDAQAALA